MKFRVVILSIVLCAVLLCGYTLCEVINVHDNHDNIVCPPTNIYVGMPYEEFDALYSDRGYGLLGYEFVYDEDNNPVVVTWGPLTGMGNASVTSVTAYDKNTINFSEEAFYKIEKEMSIHEVVSIVGNPYGAVSDLHDLGWMCGDIRYVVRFRQSEDNPNVLVVTNILRESMTDGTFSYLFDYPK